MSHEDWSYPLGFIFHAEFQWGSDHAAASFMEISGLDQEMVFQETQQQGDDGAWLKLPRQVKHGNLVLKRPLEPLSEKITEWVKSCLAFSRNGWINPSLLVITLCNERGEVAASWECSRAFPIKWGLSALDSQKSGLAIETLTLNYNILERKI